MTREYITLKELQNENFRIKDALKQKEKIPTKEIIKVIEVNMRIINILTNGFELNTDEKINIKKGAIR